MKIASRASWGARYVDGVGNRPVGSLQKYLHHTVTKHLPANATVAQERVEMRTVERIGQQRFGRGISYTLCIFPSGRIYWGASLHRISYHSGGGNDGKPRNTLGVGIALVGNTHANEVTREQQDSLVWLLQHGVRSGWWSDPAITEGHRDFKATSCPGDYAYRLIPTINRRARGGTYADFKRNGLPTGGGGSAPKPERTWLDMASKDDVTAAVQEGVLTARVKVRRGGKEVTRTLRTLISGNDANQQRMLAELAETRAVVEGLNEALLAVGEVSGMDREQVQGIVASTIRKARVDLTIPMEEGAETDG